MKKDFWKLVRTGLLVLAVLITASAPALANVTINLDPGSAGFNDSTPVAPVGGNSGTTLGQQRLNAFIYAAGIWGATLNSGPTISIRITWHSLPCSTLGQTGSQSMHRNFPNAPFPNTWYATALANAISGTDLNGAAPEILAEFNSDFGTNTCLGTPPWYFGLDGNHGSGVDLVETMLHEFAHGFGFATFTSGQTGAPAGGFFTVYDRFLRDDTTGKLWINMTNSERAASALNTGNLVWAGPQVTSDIPTVLGGSPSLRINSPSFIAGTYAIGTADFGPSLSSPGITANVVQTLPFDGCTPVAGGVSGKIAFIDRGSCNFTVKVKNAQNAGAIGVIIGNVNSSPNPDIPPGMGGTDPTITIPSVSLALNDANSIRQAGGNINATMFLDPTIRAGADSANRGMMYAPSSFASGSSVSHFDTSMFPNQLMEPFDSPDLTQSVRPPQDLTFSLLRDIGWTGASASTTIQFATSSTSVNENIGSVVVNVTRTGDTSGTSTVDYATSDTAGNTPCNVSNGAASSRCDYLMTLGTLTFAPGETTQSIQVPIIDDSFGESAETFTISLSNATGATLGSSTETITINDGAVESGTNPIDTPGFFVRQHYIDFLNREPDTAGFNFWVNEITSCGSNAACIETKRVNVSAAFFLSIEFQETGYLVYRVYKSAFGNLSGAPVPIALNDFLRDTQKIGQGVQVNVGNWQAQLEANKQAFTLAFVQRPDFLAAYPNSMTAADFVNQLNARTGNVLSPAEQANLINTLGATPADVNKRSQVLRAVAEDPDLKAAEFNRAFVLMQYFGYMRRNPNDFPDADFAGFNFWLDKLNQFNGDFLSAEMVKAFITSDEYRHRFGN